MADPLNDPLPGPAGAGGSGPGAGPGDRYRPGDPAPTAAPETGTGVGADGAAYGTAHETPYESAGSGAYREEDHRGQGHGTGGYPAGGHHPAARDTYPLGAGTPTADRYGTAGGAGIPDDRDATTGASAGASTGTDHGPAAPAGAGTADAAPRDIPYGAIADPYGAGSRTDADAPTTVFPPSVDPYGEPVDPYGVSADPYGVSADAHPAPALTADPETMALRRPDDLLAAAPADPVGPTGGHRRAAREASAGEAGTDRPSPAAAGGGRAARRKAEKARRASRANKLANVAGELMMTTGVLLLLFVTYQLWWTNVEARAHADREANSLIDQWEGGSEEAPDNRDPGVFSAGEGFALLYLPTLDVRVPIAESVDEATVLDKGMVGRYSEADRLPTAMPWDEEGNVGLAGHRNTHGEPFRYINLLNEGDPIIVETETTYYVYEMRSRLDSTSPSNIAVLDPIPEQGGFTEPGRYITLTTCTPEFTSTFRLIVWGEMVAEQPRGEGKPDALVT
nr:class E sortase [Streptomyces alkaliphilus]